MAGEEGCSVAKKAYMARIVSLPRCGQGFRPTFRRSGGALRVGAWRLPGPPALMQPYLVLASQPVAIIMSSDFQWSQGKAL